MIKPEQVPPEVVAALVNALYDNRVDVAWSDASAAIATALSAWDGAMLARDVIEEQRHLILPFREASDE